VEVSGTGTRVMVLIMTAGVGGLPSVDSDGVAKVAVKVEVDWPAETVVVRRWTLADTIFNRRKASKAVDKNVRILIG
jgi:hypothetical protein